MKLGGTDKLVLQYGGRTSNIRRKRHLTLGGVDNYIRGWAGDIWGNRQVTLAGRARNIRGDGQVAFGGTDYSRGDRQMIIEGTSQVK